MLPRTQVIFLWICWARKLLLSTDRVENTNSEMFFTRKDLVAAQQQKEQMPPSA